MKWQRTQIQTDMDFLWILKVRTHHFSVETQASALQRRRSAAQMNACLRVLISVWNNDWFTFIKPSQQWAPFLITAALPLGCVLHIQSSSFITWRAIVISVLHLFLFFFLSQKNLILSQGRVFHTAEQTQRLTLGSRQTLTENNKVRCVFCVAEMTVWNFYI